MITDITKEGTKQFFYGSEKGKNSMERELSELNPKE